MRHLIKLSSLITDEEGATMVEYAIMVVFIAAVCIGLIDILGEKVFDLFNTVDF